MTKRPQLSVIDDDVSVRESLRGLLHQIGYDVETFESAEAFLASEKVDCAECLILDVTMPGMSGPALQRELKHRRPTIPIIFITAQHDATVRSRVLADGAVECLFKPFSEEGLLKALGIALGRAQP